MNTKWQQQDVKVRGVSFHYTRTGNGSKPAMVLAHGFSDSGLCWLPFAQDMEKDYDVILPDARGHGLSARVELDQHFDAASDLAGLIKKLGVAPVILGGHSMGANTSARLAARYGSLVKALILEDPGWHEFKPSRRPKVVQQTPNPWFEWLLNLEGVALEEVMAKCRADSPSWADIELEPWAESKLQMDRNFVLGRHFRRTNWAKVIQAIACPTLLLIAETSKGAIVTPEVAAQAAALNPHIQVVKVDGPGHNIRRENYPGFKRAVQDFLAKI